MIKKYFEQYLTQLQACFIAQTPLSEQLMSIHRESNDYDAVYQVITTYLKDEDHVEHFHVQGRTALDLAVAYNHFTLVRWLLKKGISKERCQHAMDQAIISGNVKLLLLINHYAQATA
jgi:hypothetical protein